LCVKGPPLSPADLDNAQAGEDSGSVLQRVLAARERQYARQGNTNARIFIHSMQAELVSVAGIYRNFEQQLPEHLYRKPVQIHLQDDRLVIAAIAA